MQLPYNMFITSALLIVALAGVATWSLLAISRLFDVKRGNATQPLRALRMGTSLREQLGGLPRTEMDARPAAGEPAQKAWNDRAARIAKGFDLLRSFLGTEEERSEHQEAIPALTIYRRLAAMGPGLDAERRFADIIAASSDRLLRLVNQVLELSRLRARLLPLERRAVDMEKVVVRAREELRPQVEDKCLVVGRATKGSDFALQGDEDPLRRVVSTWSATPSSSRLTGLR